MSITLKSYSRETLISLYKQQNIEQVLNPNDFQSFVTRFPQIFKSHSYHPVAYYKGQELSQIKQEFLLYQSNLNTPLKTVGIQKSDQFSFDGKFLTPQPQEKYQDQFDFNLQNPSIRNLIPVPIFSYSRWLNFRSLNQKLWYYIDEENYVQGPFTSIEMDTWFTKGYFDNKLKISFMSTNSESFFPLRELRNNNYLRLDKQNKKNLRKQSAPQILTLTQAKVIKEGAKTSYQKSDNKFDFNEDQQQNKQEQNSQRTQNQQIDNGEQQVFSKVLYIPKDKIGKKKKKK